MTTDTDISYLAIHETDNLLLVCFRNMDSIFGMLVKLSVGDQAPDYSPEDYEVEFLGIFF